MVARRQEPVSLDQTAQVEGLQAQIAQEEIWRSRTDRWIKFGAFLLVSVVAIYALGIATYGGPLADSAFDLVKILAGAAAGYALSRGNDSA